MRGRDIGCAEAGINHAGGRAGVAALPLCYALLGWPAATAGLLLTAWLTQVSINIMMRCALHHQIL